MPTYDCYCTKCGWVGERTVKVAERDRIPCERCNYLLARAPAAPMGRMAGQYGKGGGPDRFTADMLGIPLKELPSGLRTEPQGGNK